MNIHEHQAKKILKEYGAPISNGIVITSLDEISEKIKKLKVFCAFQKVQDSLTNYKKINLSYINQVVATMY